jgi:hypothetical protein
MMTNPNMLLGLNQQLQQGLNFAQQAPPVLAAVSPNGFSYNCEFQGIANTGLPIQNVQELTWCIRHLSATPSRNVPTIPLPIRRK